VGTLDSEVSEANPIFVDLNFMKIPNIFIALTLATVTIAITKPWLVIAQPQPIAQPDTEEIERQTTVKSVAAKVTVQIRVGDGGGSGVLIGKKGNKYLVLTNAHVVRAPTNITIQTADGQTHTATRVKDIQTGKFDVALLEFTSPRAYQLAGLKNFGSSDIVLNEGREVFAAGFPYNSKALKVVGGEVKQLPQEAFINGTQIGYVTKSNLEQGMSGGPILDSFGNLIGINSTLAYPVIPTYTYTDGTKAPPDKVAEYARANWGVPMYNLLTRLNPDILSGYQHLPRLRREVTPTGYMAQLDRRARLVTVRIENADGNGSGVIIAREGDSYYVLTAEHVVKKTQNLNITTHDQRRYTINPTQIKRSQDTDLAIIKFTSTQPYQIATLGNYSVSNDAMVFPGGWPAPTKINSQQWQWQLNPGVISSQTQGIFQTQNKRSFDNGYDSIYSSITYGGMSGGPVFDSAGRVIAIHGRAEGGGSIGNSLGISIINFIDSTEKFGINIRNLQVDRTAPIALDRSQLQSVELVSNSIAIPRKFSDLNQWIEYGNQLYRQKKFAAATIAFDRAIQLQPDLLIAHYGRGLALLADRPEDAIGSFNRAIELVPANNRPSFYYLWSYRSQCLAKVGRYDDALSSIVRAIDLEPTDILLLNDKANILMGLGKYPEAISIHDRIIARDRKNWVWSMANRGIAKFESGDVKGAISDYDIAIKIDPRSWSNYHNRGNAKYKIGDNGGAINDYSQAISLNPNFAITYAARGLVKQKMGNSNGAIVDYTKAIDIDPDFAEAYDGRSIAKSSIGDIAGSTEDHDRAGRILQLRMIVPGFTTKPSVVKDLAKYNEPFVLSGNDKMTSKDWQGAILDYNRAIEKNPQNHIAYYFRGVVKAELGNRKGAISDYNVAISIDGNDTDFYYARGIVKQELGDKNGAISDYSRAIELDSKNISAYKKLHDLLIEP
jgi:tetratricopeptide (TPR) repeat protein/S1-C subfamily serine protease